MNIEELQSLIGIQLGVRKVSETSRFFEDLEAESADILNIVAAVEDRCGIEIGEEELADLRSVRDLFELIQRREAS